MNSWRRPLATLVSIALVALLGACGSSTPTVTAAGGNGASANHEQAVKFAKCMRGNGVSTFPDPPASGALTIDGVLNGSSLDPDSAVLRRALAACKSLQPAGFTGQKATPRQMTARLEFARCMRENGVSDFPDPTADGPLIDTNRIPSLAGKDPRSDPGLNAAMQKCRNFASAAGVVGP